MLRERSGAAHDKADIAGLAARTKSCDGVPRRSFIVVLIVDTILNLINQEMRFLESIAAQ
jgi:hypothetical protein